MERGVVLYAQLCQTVSRLVASCTARMCWYCVAVQLSLQGPSPRCVCGGQALLWWGVRGSVCMWCPRRRQSAAGVVGRHQSDTAHSIPLRPLAHTRDARANHPGRYVDLRSRANHPGRYVDLGPRGTRYRARPDRRGDGTLSRTMRSTSATTPVVSCNSDSTFGHDPDDACVFKEPQGRCRQKLLAPSLDPC